MSTLPVREPLVRRLTALTPRPPHPTPPQHRAGTRALLAIALLLFVGNARVGLAFSGRIAEALTAYETLLGAVVFGFTVLSYLPHFALLAAPLLATLHVHRKWVRCEEDAPAFARVLGATLALVAAAALLLLSSPGPALMQAAWLAEALPWVQVSQLAVLPLSLGLVTLTFHGDVQAAFRRDSPQPYDAARWRVLTAAQSWQPGGGLRARVRRSLAFTRKPVPTGPPAYRAAGHLLRGLCWTLLGGFLGGLLFFAFVLSLFLFATAGGPAAFHVDAPHYELLGVVVLFQFVTLAGLLGALGLVLAGNAVYRAWVHREPHALRVARLTSAAALAAGLGLLALAPHLTVDGLLVTGTAVSSRPAAWALLAAGGLLGALALRRDVRDHLGGP